MTAFAMHHQNKGENVYFVFLSFGNLRKISSRAQFLGSITAPAVPEPLGAG